MLSSLLDGEQLPEVLGGEGLDVGPRLLPFRFFELAPPLGMLLEVHAVEPTVDVDQQRVLRLQLSAPGPPTWQTKYDGSAGSAVTAIVAASFL